MDNKAILPPHSVEVEKSLLGIVIDNPYLLDDITEILDTSEHFYNYNTKTIYEQVLFLHRSGYPIDITTVSEQLRKIGKLDEVGGAYEITLLCNKVTSTAPAFNHAYSLKEMYLKREQINAAQELLKQAYDLNVDVFETFEQIEQQLFNLSQIQSAKQASPISVVTDKVIKTIHEIRASDSNQTGVSTGFADIDSKTNGWQDTDLIIIAARPAVGKSAFCLNLGYNACIDIHKPTPTVIFNLEMEDKQLSKRVLSAMSKVPLEKINKPKSLEDGQMTAIEAARRAQSSMKLYIDDTPALSIPQLRSKLRRWIKKYGIGLAIIDYLQLMTGTTKKGGNREQEISSISRDLKRIAKETGIPIIALSQLNRDIEKRANQEPQLSDLRESGAIEQDADIILFLYNFPENLIKEDFAQYGNKKVIKCAKHRNGDTFEVALTFQKEIQLFADVNPFAGQPPPDNPRAGFQNRPYPTSSQDKKEDLPF